MIIDFQQTNDAIVSRVEKGKPEYQLFDVYPGGDLMVFW